MTRISNATRERLLAKLEDMSAQSLFDYLGTETQNKLRVEFIGTLNAALSAKYAAAWEQFLERRHLLELHGEEIEGNLLAHFDEE